MPYQEKTHPLGLAALMQRCVMALGPFPLSPPRAVNWVAPMDQRSIEENVARELLHYFTGQHPTGVKYDDQPQEVRELWLGAARIAISAIKASQT